MKRLSWIPAFALLGAAFTWVPADQEPTRYVIDRSHTTLGFSARHMLVTNVKGKFNDFSGEILLDEQDMTKSSVKVTISTASLDTDNHVRVEACG
jgi:polyisoprenoid-binding protein YceI